MGSLKQIKSRINSVNSTKKITKTMELISAIKFQKSYDRMLGLKRYTAEFDKISRVVDFSFSPTIQEENSKTPYSLYIIVSSDRGLSGSYLSNLRRYIADIDFIEAQVEFLLLGKKLKSFFQRKFAQYPLETMIFAESKDFITFADNVFDRILPEILSGRCKKINIVYTSVESVTKQEIITKNIFEHVIENLEGNDIESLSIDGNTPIIDLDKQKLGEYIFYENIRLHILNAILNSQVADHLNRMMAMKKATESSQEIMDVLKLEYNKSRQAQITREIIEIVSGMDHTEESNIESTSKYIFKI
jgi:F-type H+-transporting ATPase subunit gamma